MVKCVNLTKEDIRVLSYAMHLLEGDYDRVEDGFTDRRVGKVREKIDDIYHEEIEEAYQRRN